MIRSPLSESQLLCVGSPPVRDRERFVNRIFEQIISSPRSTKLTG
jgi:hypothetical protein